MVVFVQGFYPVLSRRTWLPRQGVHSVPGSSGQSTDQGICDSHEERMSDVYKGERLRGFSYQLAYPSSPDS